jgi:probable rRNA maturation factor
MLENFSVLNKTKSKKGKLLRLPFADIKNAVLGEDYELSLVIVSKAAIRKLNKAYREKDYPTDILSFGLGKTSGEIFINLDVAFKKAKEFGRNTEGGERSRTNKDYLGFLFIHGLYHLKGYDHGKKMEKLEQDMCKKFGFA